MVPALEIREKFDRLDVSSYSTSVAIVDKNIVSLYPGFVKENFHDVITVETGEEQKKIDNVVPLLKQLSTKNLDRHSCLIALGGGVVGDITGFMAAIYMRGISFIQVPTTYMAMCDPIIGKVAISNERKNEFGAFSSPERIIVYEPFLQSLTAKHIYNGLAEVLKHYYVTRDDQVKRIIHTILTTDGPERLHALIDGVRRSYSIKKHFVESDPYDLLGEHKALSFGHTFANAYENIFTKQISHGEAVMNGMDCALRLSHALGLLPEHNYTEYMGLLKDVQAYGARHEISSVIVTEDLIPRMIESFRTDKISENGMMRFVLLSPNGHCIRTLEEGTVTKILLSQSA